MFVIILAGFRSALPLGLGTRVNPHLPRNGPHAIVAQLLHGIHDLVGCFLRATAELTRCTVKVSYQSHKEISTEFLTRNDRPL